MMGIDDRDYMRNRPSPDEEDGYDHPLDEGAGHRRRKLLLRVGIVGVVIVIIVWIFALLSKISAGGLP